MTDPTLASIAEQMAPMAREGTISLANTLDEIPRLEAMVEAHCARHGLGSLVRHELTLVLEELFSNVVKYGYSDGARHEIRVSIRQCKATVVLEMEDDGSAFDPLSLPEPDIEGDADSRPVGGLGVHLVRRVMDDVSYERRGASNYLRLSKRVDR